MRAILTYHSIDTSGSPISCHPDAFDRHIAWLSGGGARVTTVDELIALPPTVDAVALTFDDAFVNFRDVAAPRLRAHGLPATLFVVADCAGSTNDWGGRGAEGIPRLPLLDWDALAALAEKGVSLGSHTRTHSDLVGLPPRILEEEVHGSADIIERRTGMRPSVFAYPYGRVDAHASSVVSRVFPHACTTEFRTLGEHECPVLLPRLDMYYFQRPGGLEQWGTAALTTRIAMRRELRRVRHLAGHAATAMHSWRILR
jgi:peptidoglycan/xylan/chitin deacetylase (PgdA/CDA1 family)